MDIGLKVDDSVINDYNDLKQKKAYRYMIYKVE